MTRHLRVLALAAALLGFSPPNSQGQDGGLMRSFNTPGPQVLWLQTLEASLPAKESLQVSWRPSAGSQEPASFEGEKSRGAAVLRSLILPGWGQRYAGSRKASYFFFVSEVLLWTGHIWQQAYGDWLREDARVFAATHAGIDPEGKPKDFFVDIGNYTSLDDYNNDQLRRRRTTTLYPREPGYNWYWDTETNRLHYRRLRVRSDEAFNRATFFVGGVFANHLISAIHSIWAVNRYNRRFASQGGGVHLGVETRGADRSVVLRVWHRL